MEATSSNPILISHPSFSRAKSHRRSIQINSVIAPEFRNNLDDENSISTRSSRASSKGSRKNTFERADLASRTVFTPTKKEQLKSELPSKKVSFKEADIASRTVASTQPYKERKMKSPFRLSGVFSKKNKEKEVEQIIELEDQSMAQSGISKKQKLSAQVLNLKLWNFFPVSGALFMELCNSNEWLISERIRVVKLMTDLRMKRLQGAIESTDELALSSAKDELNSIDKQLNEMLEERRNSWEASAEQHLAEETMPKLELKTKDRVNYEEILIAMARQLLLKNPVKRIEGGSGGLYLICNEEKPLFVFKPSDEAPGSANNPHFDFSMIIEDDRIIDEARLPFPISEDSLREYAIGVLKGKKIVLASLNIQSSKEEKQGVLIEYIDHLFTIDALNNHVQLSYRQKEMEKPLGKLDFDRLKKGYEDAATNLNLTKKLSHEQQKVVDECVSFLFEKTSLNIGAIIPKSQLPIWNKISTQSLDLMILELFEIPNFDPNGRNLLLQHSFNSYEIAGIDAGQTFPDTWSKSLNAPPWLNAERFEIPMNQLPSLYSKIQYFNAYQTLKILKSFGVVFQENEQIITHPITKEKIKVGGDLINILNTFHTVAKIGCLNENSVNDIAHVIYDQDRLHRLFVKTEELFRGNDESLIFEDEYQDLLTHKDYALFFKDDCYQTNTKKFWKLFEAVILEQLNKSKRKEK